jgi:hypothetical protein
MMANGIARVGLPVGASEVRIGPPGWSCSGALARQVHGVGTGSGSDRPAGVLVPGGGGAGSAAMLARRAPA